MVYTDVAPIPKQMTILVGLLVVALMAFGLALSYYKNVLFDQQLLAMERRNEALKASVDDQYHQLEYYRSAHYRDKYAKENFGLLQSGEKVVMLSSDEPAPMLGAETDRSEEERQAIFEQNLRNIRIVDQWNMYFFHRQEIEKLRTSLIE